MRFFTTEKPPAGLHFLPVRDITKSANSHWQCLTVSAVLIAIGAASPQTLQPPTNRLPSSTISVLQHADQFELLSLDPKYGYSENGSFHGYRVLGRVVISDANTHQKLVSALLQGMRENSGEAAHCFNPRHGIYAIRKGNQADLVICFECLQVQLFGAAQGGYLVSRSPQAVFDAVLKAHLAH